MSEVRGASRYSPRSAALCCRSGNDIIGIDRQSFWGCVMDGEIKSQAEADEDILTFDIADDILERAANAQAYTLVYCTHPWQCPWPSITSNAN
jgi:hypothetical protein